MKESRLKKLDEKNSKIRKFLIASFFFITYIEPYLNGAIGSVVKYYIFFVVGGLLFYSRRFTLRTYHYAFIFWLLYKFFSLLWTTDYTIFEIHFLTHLSSVSLLICITAVDDYEECYELIKKTMLIGSTAIGILALFMSYPYEGVSNRLVLRLFGYQLDPNNQAAFMVYGVAIALYCLIYEKKHRILYSIIILINSYITLITGSRGGLIAIAAIVLTYIITFYNRETAKNNFKKIILIILIVALVVMVIIFFLPEDIATRLFDFSTYEGGNNRDHMWRHGFNMLSSPANLIMGAGWGAYKTNGYTSLHNTFLSTLCDIGLIGFSLLFIPPFKAAITMLKKKNILPFSILVSGMVPAFFFESINKRSFWNAIIFVFVAYNCHLKNNKNKKIKQVKKYE